MHQLIYFRERGNKDQFRIDYPYYGLFGSADIICMGSGPEAIYRCTLLNRTVLDVKKPAGQEKWIDVGLGKETPLSITLGNAIDEFLKKQRAPKGK